MEVYKSGTGNVRTGEGRERRLLAAPSYIQTPATLSNKNAIGNVQNYEDEKCFLWSVLDGLHSPASNLHRFDCLITGSTRMN